MTDSPAASHTVAGGLARRQREGALQVQIAQLELLAVHLVPIEAGPGLGETGPLSQGVQARRKALRIRYICIQTV